MISRIIIGLLLSAICHAAPTQVQRMTVSKMRMADLESSASGYVYNQQQGLPVSYVQYTNHGSGRYYHAPATVHYVVGAAAPVAPAVPEAPPRYEPALLAYATAGSSAPRAEERSNAKEEIANYANEPLSKYVPALGSIKPEPRAPYYVPAEVAEKEKAEVDETSEEEEDEDEDDDDDEEEEEEDEDDVSNDSDVSEEKFEAAEGVGLSEKVFKGFDKARVDGSSFEAGDGEKYAAEEYDENGEKGNEGYKKQKEFSEGEDGRYNNGNRKGYYDIEDGQKKEHVDTEEKYGSAEEEEKNEEGDSYGHKTYHKKGHKTNGFHNIYHKDEYKKDTDFYDDEHKEGHFVKHEELGKHHKASEGGFKKGRHHSSDFDHQDRGKKGYYDKGHHKSQDRGHEAEEDEKSYYANHADYATKEGSNSAKTHKFSKGSEHR